jgi:hypothetical protein
VYYHHFLRSTPTASGDEADPAHSRNRHRCKRTESRCMQWAWRCSDCQSRWILSNTNRGALVSSSLPSPSELLPLSLHLQDTHSNHSNITRNSKTPLPLSVVRRTSRLMTTLAPCGAKLYRGRRYNTGKYRQRRLRDIDGFSSMFTSTKSLRLSRKASATTCRLAQESPTLSSI